MLYMIVDNVWYVSWNMWYWYDMCDEIWIATIFVPNVCSSQKKPTIQVCRVLHSAKYSHGDSRCTLARFTECQGHGTLQSGHVAPTGAFRCAFAEYTLSNVIWSCTQQIIAKCLILDAQQRLDMCMQAPIDPPKPGKKNLCRVTFGTDDKEGTCGTLVIPFSCPLCTLLKWRPMPCSSRSEPKW